MRKQLILAVKNANRCMHPVYEVPSFQISHPLFQVIKPSTIHLPNLTPTQHHTSPTFNQINQKTQYTNLWKCVTVVVTVGLIKSNTENLTPH